MENANIAFQVLYGLERVLSALKVCHMLLLQF